MALPGVRSGPDPQINRILKMTSGGTKHAKKVLTDEQIYTVCGISIKIPLISQPMCEHCENIGIWDWDKDMFGQEVVYCYCQKCGTLTKNPITYGEYMAMGYDLPDAITGREREEMLEAKKLLNLMFNIEGRDGNEITIE